MQRSYKHLHQHAVLAFPTNYVLCGLGNHYWQHSAVKDLLVLHMRD